jgi:hypothetical protein
MIFRSKYANHIISLPNSKNVKFANGQLDTTAACKQVGLSDDALIKALKGGKYYGRDYSATDEPAPAPKAGK